MRTRPLWCALWRDAFTETLSGSRAVGHISRDGPLLPRISPFGEIAPLNQSRTIYRFRTLPLDRQLRCSCLATAEEVEVNSYAVEFWTSSAMRSFAVCCIGGRKTTSHAIACLCASRPDPQRSVIHAVWHFEW
jgi:hypothetical protein